MRCADFLAFYSDYRDGLLDDPGVRRRCEAHLRTCRRCARYGEIVDRGLALLRDDAVEPTRRFRQGLRLRLGALDRARPKLVWPAGVAASLLIFTGIVEGVVQTSRQIEAPAPVPGPVLPKVTALPGYPFVTFSQLSVPAFEIEVTTAEPEDPLEYAGTYRTPTGPAYSVKTALDP